MASTKLPKYWFPGAQLVAGVIFSIAIQKYGQPFHLCVTIYITVMISITTYWLENREIEIISESQMLAHLKKVKYPVIDNVIGSLKIKELGRINQELESSIFELNSSQLDDYTTKAIEYLLQNKAGSLCYYAVHLVNEPYYLGIFGNSSPEDEDQVSFVEPQCKLLNSGGEVIRIFIFEPHFFAQNKAKCLDMLERHDNYYRNTKNKVTTLIYRPRQEERLGNDISIVSDSVAFEWIRSTNSKGYLYGKCFIKSEDKIGLVDKFNSIRKKAVTKDIFLSSIQDK